MPDRTYDQLPAAFQGPALQPGADGCAREDRPPPPALPDRGYAQLPVAFRVQAQSSQHGAGAYARLELPAAPFVDSEC